MEKSHRKLYTWQMILNFSEECDEVEGHVLLRDPYVLSVDLSPVTKLYNKAFRDKNLQMNHKNLVTPLGVASRKKYELVKILEWLCLFKIFQEGAIRSFKSPYFANYKTQKNWYLLVSEHEQAKCLAAEIVHGKIKKTQSFKKIIDPKKELLNNYEKCISNGCVEEPLQAIATWMEQVSEYEEYVKIFLDLPIKKLEQQITRTLIRHYKMAIRYKAICGGLIFDWYSANPGESEAFGEPFYHEKKIKDFAHS